MEKISIQALLDSAVHFGHKTQKWNPKMKRYLYGSRSGVHIFDLQKTQECLEKALDYVKNAAANGKTILFVSTKPQAARFVVDAARETKMPFVVHKWMGGLLTNFSTIKQRIRYLKKLKDEEQNGEFDKYTKKEAADLRKERDKLEAALGGLQDLDRKPDIVFVASVQKDHLAVKEARKMKIPVVGIVDSNGDPTGVTYVIPGNDDAVKSLEFIIKKVAETIVEGKRAK